jgi:hypothetical protein
LIYFLKNRIAPAFATMVATGSLQKSYSGDDGRIPFMSASARIYSVLVEPLCNILIPAGAAVLIAVETLSVILKPWHSLISRSRFQQGAP